ncbi:unnamed protein product (macronuclear) [Paramecium tetraurelia]|uniref:acetyl-CoA C-acetyltransferase n=1 Tax=Paramecium tetraurelia TaxID=5888 RepID=A0EEK7_PARTE|nr:uncharacterized protein GSPATT00026070001 [Paramecium tetraurelia]CAK93742.1 unnamed protein product [Paramecium tetraurelia]|eukprot:XP_001461121.1 hypothetical protein (macronuclear) [Paramecium tetraurelia strain d4-2]
MKAAYIVSAARTPIGCFLGKLSKVKATELGATAIKGALSQVSIPQDAIDEAILGNVCSAGIGQAPARQAVIKAGLPSSTPCTTINKVCSSGMKSVTFGSQSIQLGQSNIVITGGFESMSNIPHYINARQPLKYGDGKLLDGLATDGLSDAYSNVAMGVCAEKTVNDLKLTRQLQDDYTITSYERALESIKTGRWAHEITPVQVSKNEVVTEDEEVKRYQKEKIPILNPVFAKNGSVTAANSSKINDGACAIILASEEALKKYNLTPLARIVSYADAELDPMDFCIAPTKSSAKALQRAGLKLTNIDYHEINEAFAATVLANMKLLDLPLDRINVNGGAVALGHPIGMSGARIILSLLTVLKQNQGKYGLAGICNGGGGATSIIIENLN